jgi:hypothetical protein
MLELGQKVPMGWTYGRMWHTGNTNKFMVEKPLEKGLEEDGKADKIIM